MDDKRIELLDTQLSATYIFIAITIVLTTVTYNVKLGLENKEQIYTDEEARNIELSCRVIAIIILFVYLYINIENKRISTKKEGFNLQIFASILTIAAGIIVLYVAASENNQSILSNPEV